MAPQLRGVVAWGLVALVCLALGIPSVEAVTSTGALTSTADTMLDEGSSGRNNGTCTTNRIEARSGTNSERILVQFDVSTIPSDAAIKSANLALVHTATSTATNRTQDAHQVTTAWGEGNKCNGNCATPGATWAKKDCTTEWTTAGGDFNATATASVVNVPTTGTVTWNIKADVQAYVLGTATNNGTLIKDSLEDVGASNIHTYGMKENTTASNRPSITVTYLRQVTGLTASARSGAVDLNWTLPSPGADYNGTLIVRKSGSDFTSNSSTNPTDTTAYSAGNSLGDGTVVANLTGSETSFTDTGCSNGTTCYYRIFARDSSVNYSASTTSGADPTYPKINATPPDGTTQVYNWNYATGATTLAPPGLNPNGVVVTGSNDNKVHGMSASNGARSFTPFATGNAVQSRPPIIPSGFSSTGLNIAYVTSQDGRAYGVNTATGAQVWQSASLGTTLQGGAAVWLQAIKGVTFTGGVTDDVVFVTTRNTGDTATNKVYARNGLDGTAVWTFNSGGTSTVDGIASTPAIDYFSSTLWVSSLSNGGTQPSLWKLNAVTGALITSFSLGDITSSPSASLDGSLSQAPSFIYVGTDAGTLRAIKVSDNSVITHTPASGSGAVQGFPLSFSWDAPSVGTPDTIIFSRTNTIHSVSFNGTSFSVNWTTTLTGSPTVSTPIDNFVGTKLYVGASDGKIHQLNQTTGADEAQVSTLAVQTVGDPSFDIDLGRAYVGATDGRIYAFPSPF